MAASVNGCDRGRGRRKPGSSCRPARNAPWPQAEHPHHVWWVAILGEIAIGGVDVDDDSLRIAPVAERFPRNLAGGFLIRHAGIEPLARLDQDELKIMLQFAHAVL